MRKKGFTLIELLVVIGIIAMLLAILMPALSKVKKIAQRVVCGANLKGLGNAHVVYANDYSDQYCVSKGKPGVNPTLSTATDGWQTRDLVAWTSNNITVGASLYLLVREADVSPKSFVCPSGDQKEFSGKNTGGVNNASLDLTDLWDFGHPDWPTAGNGEGPARCVSYAYQMPYASGTSAAKGSFAASNSNPSACAIMADRNPWLDAKLKINLSSEQPTFLNEVAILGLGSAPAGNDWSSFVRWQVQVANAHAHSRDGQNVLFSDGHSSYETRSDVGSRNDNIYTRWNTGLTGDAQRRQGAATATEAMKNLPSTTNTVPQGSEDSVLVNDFVRP